MNATAGGLDIDADDGIAIDAVGAAGEDIVITNTGGSISLVATEAVVDAIVLNASVAGGGIDITSNEDIDISTTGAAGEDISLTNTGGSINLSSTENAASAIYLLTNGGTSETIVVTNTQGTDPAAIGLTSSAAGKRVMIITDGGGMGVNIADACEQMGLSVPGLPEEVEEELRAAFPSYYGVGNPLDLTGSATDESFAFALSKTMSGDFYDMVIVAALWGPPALTDKLPGMLAQKPGFTEKPIIACTPGGAYSRDRIRLFHEAGLPAFSTPEAAVRAASVLSKGRWRL